MPPSDGAWGFAKYLITIITATGTYVCYFNCLDSKYGFTDSTSHTYGRDWELEYDTAFHSEYKVRFKNAVNSTVFDSLKPSEIKEFKPWKIIYGRSEPFERKFYARSSPFPVSFIAAKNYGRVYTIGSKLLLDTVYSNLGTGDIYGYNTQNDPYYSNQNPIILPFSIPGNSYVTPGTIFNPDTTITGDEVVGIKIIADPDDSLILKKDKKLWIYGVGIQANQGGDTMLMRFGSHLELGQNSEIITLNGGVYIDSGASRKWNNSSCQRAFEGCSMNFYGYQDTVNNGSFMVIDGDATLKVGDSTTLTFDGANTHLDLKSNSQVILGLYAKLVFKNGAYLKANGAIFNSYNNSSLWEGIVFENSGKDSVVNCTFSNAVTSLKIINSNSYAAQLRLIKNNTFNVPAGGKYGVYALNCVNINLQDNTFNMPVTSGSYVGAYFQE